MIEHSDEEPAAVSFIKRLVAWDCCGTCAGRVLAARDRAISALAWQEGFDAGENMAHMWGHVDSWEDPPENPYHEGGARP